MIRVSLSKSDYAFPPDDRAAFLYAHQSHQSRAAIARKVTNVTDPAIVVSNPATNAEVSTPVAATLHPTDMKMTGSIVIKRVAPAAAAAAKIGVTTSLTRM